MNGTPHLSIGDGWWAEGFTGQNGWLIDGQADPHDHGAQDWADAQALVIDAMDLLYRGSVDGFRDYFRQLTEFEPKRAAQHGIRGDDVFGE